MVREIVVRDDFIVIYFVLPASTLLFFVSATFVSAACDTTIEYVSCDHSAMT